MLEPTWAHVGSKKPSWSRLGGLLGRLGGILKPLGGILGPLRRILVPLGPSWRHLGGVLGPQNPPVPLVALVVAETQEPLLGRILEGLGY